MPDCVTVAEGERDGVPERLAVPDGERDGVPERDPVRVVVVLREGV